MTTKFKKGDTIQCTSDDYSCVSLGRVYTVTKDQTDHYVHMLDDDGDENYYSNEDFALVKAAVPVSTKKFKEGDKVIVNGEATRYSAHKQGQISTVSDITLEWVYLNGDKAAGRNGQPLKIFDLYVEPNTDFSIDQIGGATTIRVQRELTTAELQAIVRVLKADTTR